MEKYLIIIILKKANEIYYNLLIKEEYDELLSKDELLEKQNYLMKLEEEKELTIYDEEDLFYRINRKKIKVVGTYTIYWQEVEEW